MEEIDVPQVFLYTVGPQSFASSDHSLILLFLVAGTPAAQRQPLFASNTQQHHSQSGPSRSPTLG